MNHPPNPKTESSADASAADLRVVRHLGGGLASVSPRDFEAAYHRARRMLAAELAEPAQAVLEALLILQPESVRVVRLLGIAYMRRRLADRARAMFEYGAGLDANDVVMHLLRAECMLLCGQREPGMRLLEQTLATMTQTPDTHPFALRAKKCLLMARSGAL